MRDHQQQLMVKIGKDVKKNIFHISSIVKLTKLRKLYLIHIYMLGIFQEMLIYFPAK